MTETEISILEKKEQNDKFHSALLTHVKRHLKNSRAEMSKNYSTWDQQDSIFRGEICPDNDDKKAASQGKPTKMVVPNSFAQAMTFVSFLFLLFNQNRRFFELVGSGDEDQGKKKEDTEVLLERDLKFNDWNNKMFQFLLDVARFGLGVVEDDWTVQEAYAFIVPEAAQIPGENGTVVEQELPGAWEKFIKYEGNILKNVSPYRFFPDTDMPLSDFQRGKFCAVEEDYTVGELRNLESKGEVAGVDHIDPLPRNMNKERGGDTRWTGREDVKSWSKFSPDQDAANVLVTKVQVKIVPSKFKYGPKETKLGEEDFEVMYDLWYANDNRIIKLEPCKNWHGEFRWSIGQFTPDMQHTVNIGLSELISELQNVISWYINSHITSVRRVIANRLIVDPKIIDTKTLDGEGDIYMRKGMSTPLERAVGQLKVQDVTGAHMADADILGKIMQTVTGIGDNAMGQYNSGRRSAQESRVVTAGAAGRMKMHGHLLWESGFSRMGKHMLSNLRQSISLEMFAMSCGQDFGTVIDPAGDLAQRYIKFKGTPKEVICGCDYFTFDSTLASEKGFIAQSLQELLSVLASNPMLPLQWDISVKAIVEEIQRLRGAGSLGQFSLRQRIAGGLEAPPMPLPAPGQEANPAQPQPAAA